MMYTALCCVACGVLFQSNVVSDKKPTLDHVAIVVFSLLFLGVAGLGQDAFCQSFEWVGRLCFSLLCGGVTATLVIVYATSVGWDGKQCLNFGALGFAVGTLLTALLLFSGFQWRITRRS